MIALCSRPVRRNYPDYPVILHTYLRKSDEIARALVRWSEIKETARPHRKIYLEVDGFEIPADLCCEVLAVIEQDPSAAVLAAAVDKILSYPERALWSDDA